MVNYALVFTWVRTCFSRLLEERETLTDDVGMLGVVIDAGGNIFAGDYFAERPDRKATRFNKWKRLTQNDATAWTHINTAWHKYPGYAADTR